MIAQFAPAPRPMVPVHGEAAGFPIRRAYAVGKNFAAHTREMGGDPGHEPPMLFLKAADCVGPWESLPYPGATNDLHYEGELVVALGPGRQPHNRDQAQALIYGYGVGIDFTRRDKQGAARKRGGPWDVAKSFERAGPVSELVPMPGRLPDPETRLKLFLNDDKRQDGRIGDMIWDIPALILELAACFDLAAGDLIFTGTPAGVGAVVPGDRVRVEASGIGRLSVGIVESR